MMDKALKERIIGAIVLVAVAVLVVPVFLDGPPSQSEVVNERVPLPGQSEQDSQTGTQTRMQTVVLDRDRDQPVPARTEAQSGSAAPTTVATTPPPVQTDVATTELQPQPDVTPTPTDTPAQAAASATGMWAVQLGSFSNQDNANKLAADLRKQGFAAFLSQVSGPSGQLHRVRVGPQKDREAADAMAARLQRAGHTVKVLPHP